MQSIARIERALARIEAIRSRPVTPDNDTRYQLLRSRTQAALASLESVIAQAGRQR